MNTNYNSLEDSGWAQLQELLDASLSENIQPIVNQGVIQETILSPLPSPPTSSAPSPQEIWVGGACICLVIVVAWQLFEERLLKIKDLESLKQQYQTLLIHNMRLPDSVKSSKPPPLLERPRYLDVDVNVSDKQWIPEE